MTRDELVAYCLSKPGAWLDEPWPGDEVAKVGSKVFAFLGADDGTAAGLKCGRDRDSADEWLARYPQDTSASSHIGRFGWNSLRFNGAIPDEEILEAVDASYAAVVRKLPRRERPSC